MIPSSDFVEQRLLYRKDGSKGVWRIIGYCSEPTLTMENVQTRERENFGLSGATAETFSPVVISSATEILHLLETPNYMEEERGGAPEPRRPREWDVHITKNEMLTSYPIVESAVKETIRVREVIKECE